MSDVARFLDELGLSQYCRAFLDNAVDYDLLGELTDADLRELGVEALGHRKRILQAAARLAGAAAPEPASEPAPDPASHPRAQRRQLTLMFADLVDSTRLSASLELEVYRKVIRAYQEAATAVIEANGGYVANYVGDGVLAYFGYPQSHEDDAARAIRAGLALVARVSGIDRGFEQQRLAVRVGIETGPVVVGELIGQAAAQENAVVGSTPNLAARLQAIAEPNSVVVGPTAHRLAHDAATFHALGERELKGFDAPIPAWRVEAVAGVSDRMDAGRGFGLSPLVGRRTELGALAAAFARMRAGEAPIVHVVGEPGIGKSRLVHEFLSQIDGVATVLAGHCASHGGSTAFFPFVNLLRGWRGRAGGDADDGAQWIERLVEAGIDRRRHVPYLLKLLDMPHPVAAEVEPDLIGVRTQEALIRFILEHGRVRPTVLFVNDLHWLDERSATLLDSLARQADRQGVLVLATHRRRYEPPWRDAPGVEDLRLAPLNASESLSLFRSRFPAELAESELERLVERAGGNPLFLEELARHVESASGEGARSSGAGIPETLAGLLMQRADALTPTARRAAELAAVAGRRFDPALLGDDAGEALEELEARGIVLAEQGGGAYRFHHALVQDVIYDSLLEADRQRLHGEVGARLERQYTGREVEVAEDLARHFEVAGDARAVARYAYLAGTRALDLFALRDAETWYGKCLSFGLADGTPEDDLRFARAVVNQTQVLCWNGDFPAMVELSQRYLPRIRALGATEEVSRALTWIGEGYMHVGHHDQARATLEAALESGRTLGNESCVGYATGELMWLDSIVAEGDDFDSLPDRTAELEALGTRLGDNYLTTLAHYVRWAYATQAGRLGAALGTARRLRSFGRHSSYPPAECWGACLEAYCQARAGNAGEAESAAGAARAAAACNFDRLMADLALGMTLASIGRSDEGLALLRAAPWRTDRIGALYFAYAGDVAFGRALATSGRVKDGCDWLRDGIAWFERLGNRRAVCMAACELAEILIETSGRPRAYGGLRRRLPRMFGSRSDPQDEVRACLDRALALGEELGMQDVRVRALLLAGRLAQGANDLSTARDALASARSIAGGLDWLPLEQSVNAELRRLGSAAGADGAGDRGAPA